MQNLAIFSVIIASISAAPQSYAQAPVSYTPTAITTPVHGAAQWGSTSQSGYSTGNTATTDSEIHGGTSSNFGQSITNSGSVGTNYANQASSSNTVGGSQTQYSSATNTPSYGSYDSYSPSSSGQSQTVGGQVNNFSNSANSGSSVVGGFTTQGVSGTAYTNNQLSSGGSTTNTNSGNSASYAGGSSWSKPATTYGSYY
ncbi:hypothetical protein CONCODRAFT_4516 [Conidiobolus coronatus NRRL 28638]|uniref:Uncharacterized protein n=1 Tax=Conidiobolus coronatus (strain ATCC 28846 / CBS 209.66 / NRRL 28638) TaxID=796925 RepID=A0A137PCC0_CONC2|nr:hypothetical protein CONCODRAFT_4516 [Conidiobolus coronatus NRRL 28638]|eukprot:KXN72654.1 hypothetical protein CONCODRAFT_4516 [Conidiobolus coronatus NRRL 28638]